MLAANPKAGKSTLVRNLMLSVARGEPFFGRQCRQSNVVYLALEEPVEHVADEFRLLAAHNESIYTRVGHIPKASISKVLEEDITHRGAGLAVVDPLFDALEVDDANNYRAMNDALKQLLYMARKTGCHIMVLHHTNKKRVRGGLSVLGSQALAGATDHNVFLTRNSNGVRMFETQARVGKAFDLTQLGFDTLTHKMWIVEEGEGDVGDMAGALLKGLGDKQMTTTEWRGLVGGRNSEKAKAMKWLEKEGKVVKRAEGRHTLWVATSP